jgi:hypothetical protein
LTCPRKGIAVRATQSRQENLNAKQNTEYLRKLP